MNEYWVYQKINLKVFAFLFEQTFQIYWIFPIQLIEMIVFLTIFVFFYFNLQQIVRFFWQMPKSLTIQLSIAMNRFARWPVSVGLKWCKKHAGKFLFQYFHSYPHALAHANNIRFHLHFSFAKNKTNNGFECKIEV